MNLDNNNLTITFCDSIDQLDKQQWNALNLDNNPFIRHEFLNLMEKHHCVGEHFGWIPRHIAIHQDNQLIAAMPLYEKHNGYGEFVFDNAWENAYSRHKMSYYPKLVSAVPYTPAQGQRMLLTSGREDELQPILLSSALHLAQSIGASSFHCLFPDQKTFHFLQQQQLFSRNDCQFHWHNHHYRNFDDFLASLNAKKRKNIRQERRKIQQAGVSFRVLNGETASAEDWNDFTRFYKSTFDKKWGFATFNGHFFQALAQQIPQQIVLIMANKNNRCIAGALMYRSDNTLYGRHWGCDEDIHSLHFETCYYQGIDYCIHHNIQRFEPGAQGEYKLPRGFLPTLTQSSHWLADDYFKAAIKTFTEQERAAVLDYITDMHSQSPYKKTEPK